MRAERFVFGTVALCFSWGVALANECVPIDFLNVEISPAVSDDKIINSILNAYDVSFDPNTNEFNLGDQDGGRVSYEGPTGRSPEILLKNGTIGDQFSYVYPLSFDLEKRRIPWEDPGRVRNEDFLRFLYGETENDVRSSLTKVKTADGGASFVVTERHNVACQLEAALDRIGSEYPRVFSNVGGGFNWRLISGSSKLSSHSFGAAIDVNASIGGYWRWSGAQEGAVGDYDNQIPEGVVSAFETFGFIWGGKWHHFDGMHFEYRPELILYARLVDQN